MKVLAVAIFKGGSAKTTTSVSLGACLAEQGKRVLLVDCDPQLSATQWLGLQMDSRALYDALSGEGTLEEAVMPTSCKNLDAIPGSRWLIGIDKALAQEIGAELTLKAKLAELPDRWDIVLLDCGPSTGLLTMNVLCAAEEIVVPLETSTLSTGGLIHMIEAVKKVKERLNPKLSILGIIFCRVDYRTKLAKELIESLRNRFGDLVFETTVSQNSKLRECPSFGVPITQYDGKGKSASEYRKLAKEITTRMEAKNEQVTNR